MDENLANKYVHARKWPEGRKRERKQGMDGAENYYLTARLFNIRYDSLPTPLP